MKIILKYLLNVLLGWLLSVLIFVIFSLLIVAPITRSGYFEDTFIFNVAIFPIYSIMYLGAFIFLYTAFRYTDYKKLTFIRCFFYHLIPYIALFLLARIVEGATAKGFFNNGRLFDSLYLFLGMSLYFSFHTLIFKWVIKKVDKYQE